MVRVTFHIPYALHEFSGRYIQVEIEPSPTTLADALSALWTLYPDIRDRIATEQGEVREHINIFIGDDDVRYSGGLASPISPGCEILIVPAVSGAWKNSERTIARSLGSDLPLSDFTGHFSPKSGFVIISCASRTPVPGSVSHHDRGRLSHEKRLPLLHATQMICPSESRLFQN